MTDTEVLILLGGNSSEREVSLRSGQAVLEAAKTAGFKAASHDPVDGLELLDKLPKETIILPIFHGVGGEDGVIQAELESRGLKFLGADSQASKLCLDKSLTRQRLLENDIPVPEGTVITRGNYSDHPITNKPHILKVANGGSSIGVIFARGQSLIDTEKLDELFAMDETAILEELVEGVEITVPILGQKALPVIEIQPPETGEFDYENKYNGATAELCPPQNVSKEIQTKAQALAEKVHQVTGCRHLSRTDMIVRPDGSLVVLEINTLPGMTNQSLYPKSAQAAGLDFPALVTKFIEMTKES